MVWVFLNGQNIVSIADPGVPYPLFVLTGTLLWQMFSESVNAPFRGVGSGRSMLAKINFPRESLLLSGMYETIFNTLIKLGYSDITRIIGVVLQFAIYLTPVIYPEPKAGIAAQLMKFNPVAPILTTTRDWLLNTPTSGLNSFLVITLVALVLYILGMFFYRLAMPIVIERVGS
jgi:lipopolysaccharide transport system permease protein